MNFPEIIKIIQSDNYNLVSAVINDNNKYYAKFYDVQNSYITLELSEISYNTLNLKMSTYNKGTQFYINWHIPYYKSSIDFDEILKMNLRHLRNEILENIRNYKNYNNI